MFNKHSCFFTSCIGQGDSPVYKSDQNTPLAIGTMASAIDSNIWAIYQAKNGDYWFSSDGAYLLKGKELTHYTKKDGLISHGILGIQEDLSGNIYFDTNDGVSKYDGKQFSTLPIAEKNPDNSEWKAQPDDLWFRLGWNQNGPYRYDGDQLYQLPLPKNEMEEVFYSNYPKVSFDPYGVYSIFKDSKNNVWIGTSSLGLYRFDGTNISWMYEQHLTDTPQGGSFGIRSIVEDQDGYIWICNPKYKYYVEPKSTNSAELQSLNYKRVPGIESDESESMYFMSMTMDHQGSLWMATYDSGIWSSNGTELKHYPVKNGEKDILLFVIYTDRNGDIWAGTQGDGLYKLIGDKFEKFVLSE